MSPSPKLGGFKILRDTARLSFVTSGETDELPTTLFHLLAEEKINLTFLTCICEQDIWGIHMVVASYDASHAVRLVEQHIGGDCFHAPCSNILSLFPHKKNPHVMGALFDIFGQDHLVANAIANSPSAVSVVLEEHLLPLVSDALFVPFQFSAYRTPEDWRLAQQGKEQLYKEVVASYQERRPKVYGLECYERQELIRLKIEKGCYGDLGQPLKRYAEAGCHITFLATGPCTEVGEEVVLICFPQHEHRSHLQTLGVEWPEVRRDGIAPVTVFSMTGPHFGDRYGIISELLESLSGNGIGLLGLSCTVASVTGIMPYGQLDSAVKAIRECFDVPNVTIKED